MDIRHCLACSFTFGALLALVPAQQGQQPPAKAENPAPAVGPQPAVEGQDPETSTPKPVEETPQQRIQRLENEQAKLQQEIEYVRERASKGAMADMVRQKLTHRALDLHSIDAGASKGVEPVAHMPTQPQMRRARLMTDSEKPKMAADVLFLVGGAPIHQHEIDDLVTYLGSFSQAGDEALRTSRAVMEMLRIAAARSAFAETTADLQKQMQDLRAQVDGADSFAALAKKTAEGGANAERGGDISPVTRNSFLGPQVERMVFTTKEGTMSPAFYSPMGLSMVWVDKVEKGATPEQDQATAHMVTLQFAPDARQVQAAASRVMTGQVDLVARDEAAMQMLPAMFRPQPAQPGETNGDQKDQVKKDPVEKNDEQQAADEKAGGDKHDKKPGDGKK